MSNNYQFYNNFRGNHHTFQEYVPLPPPPPAMFMVPPPAHALPIEILDKEFVKDIEQRVPKVTTKKNKPISISGIHSKLRFLLLGLAELRNKEKELTDKVDSLSEEDWRAAVEEIKQKKTSLTEALLDVNLDTIKKAVAKRISKRQRLRRRNIERKRAKEERIKELEEKSRKIDENLQKIKDTVIKAKEEEEAKLQADVVLKEVLRKKHNAKRFINKLDALRKLRKARMNTAKGRGENVSEKEAEEFDGKIDKLKLLWAQKLTSYEKEEEDLRDRLKQDSDVQNVARESEMQKQMSSNLKKWRKVLFGDSSGAPQVNFNGDVGRFVAVRCQWDQFLNEAGTPIPVGWVVPTTPL